MIDQKSVLLRRNSICAVSCSLQRVLRFSGGALRNAFFSTSSADLIALNGCRPTQAAAKPVFSGIVRGCPLHTQCKTLFSSVVSQIYCQSQGLQDLRSCRLKTQPSICPQKPSAAPKVEDVLFECVTSTATVVLHHGCACSRTGVQPCYAMAKQLHFNKDGSALKKMQAGVDKLASVVGITLGPKVYRHMQRQTAHIVHQRRPDYA